MMGLGMLCLSCFNTRAQDYPVKPIRLIIPFATGGANDVFGRLIAQKMSQAFRQSVVSENHAGAGGSVGMEMVARSIPDGYTLVLGNIANLSVNPTLYPKLGYNPLVDLQPISLISKVPSLLVVHPSLPVRNVEGLIRLARTQPGFLTFGTGGAGSGSHLTMELFKYQAKIDLIHVPYKGVAPALVDLLAGQISMSFSSVPGVLPYIRSQRLRALATSGPQRVAILPEVVTISEAGLKQFEATLWYGLLAPAGTPLYIVDRLHDTLIQTLRSTEFQQKLAAEGAEPIGSSALTFKNFISSEIQRWAKVIKASGMRPE